MTFYCDLVTASLTTGNSYVAWTEFVFPLQAQCYYGRMNCTTKVIRSSKCRQQKRYLVQTMKLSLYFGSSASCWAYFIKVIGRSQQLFKVFIYIYFAATCFGPRWPSSGGIHNYFREVTSLQRIHCLFCIRFGKYCRRLSDM
jgi:hypothetical protein